MEPAEEEYFAVKVYTLAASDHANTVELPILGRATHDLGVESPFLNKHFWEKTNNGRHLCVVSSPSSVTVRALLRETGDRRMPVKVVQKVISTVAFALSRLHKGDIMHGGTRNNNNLTGLNNRGVARNQVGERYALAKAQSRRITGLPPRGRRANDCQN
jgi:hypothetical protein